MILISRVYFFVKAIKETNIVNNNRKIYRVCLFLPDTRSRELLVRLGEVFLRSVEIY